MNFEYGPIIAHTEVLDFRFPDLGSISIAVAQWEFLGSAGKLAGKLLLYPLFDVHQSPSGGHVEYASSQRQFALEVQLPR